MALNATLRLCLTPSLPQVQENAKSAVPFCPPWMTQGGNDEGEEEPKCRHKWPKLMVIGHRGNGMNILQSSDIRMKAIRENTILSFNSAAKFPIGFVEIDVQVTKDDCPVIFHDDFIVSKDKEDFIEKRVTDISLPEFLSYGPQKELGKVGMPLLRKIEDGRIFEWKVEKDDCLCTLQEAFEKVGHFVGFNMELKFDDHIVYREQQLKHVLHVILQVYFLTEGGSETYTDVRRNSLEEATKVCLAGDLQGIVSEVNAVLANPEAVSMLKSNKLSLLTYGLLNNMPEAVYLQLLMGVDGVIVDLVREITEAVCD